MKGAFGKATYIVNENQATRKSVSKKMFDPSTDSILLRFSFISLVVCPRCFSVICVSHPRIRCPFAFTKANSSCQPLSSFILIFPNRQLHFYTTFDSGESILVALLPASLRSFQTCHPHRYSSSERHGRRIVDVEVVAEEREGERAGGWKARIRSVN
jgi:hypothetical protein